MKRIRGIESGAWAQGRNDGSLFCCPTVRCAHCHCCRTVAVSSQRRFRPVHVVGAHAGRKDRCLLKPLSHATGRRRAFAHARLFWQGIPDTDLDDVAYRHAGGGHIGRSGAVSVTDGGGSDPGFLRVRRRCKQIRIQAEFGPIECQRIVDVQRQDARSQHDDAVGRVFPSVFSIWK